MLLLIGITLTVSFALALLVILNQRLGDPLHVLESMDPQHIHRELTPRIGGLPLALALFAGLIAYTFQAGSEPLVLWLLLICGLPVLLAGLAEDFAGKVSPAVRYSATLLSAGGAMVFADTYVSRVDVALLDGFLAWPPALVLFSLFCIAGVSQSFNIIDGKNGLALGCGGVALAAMGAAAASVGDMQLAALCWIGVASTVGLLLLNFPRGWIFLGDGGSYFLGFLVGCVAALLVSRHPQVSAWFPVVVAAYPIFETVFSFARRLLIERAGILQPDHLHFHSLLYRNLYLILRRRYRWNIWLVNAVSAAIVLMPASVFAIAAVRWYANTPMLIVLTAFAGVSYIGFYIFLRRTGSFLRA